MKKRGRGRPKKPVIQVASGYREPPADMDQLAVAKAIRAMAASWTPPPRSTLKDKTTLGRAYIEEQINAEFRRDQKFRQVLLSMADAVEKGDAYRAGFFAMEALLSQQGNILTGASPLLEKGLRAVIGDRKRSVKQKIRRS